MGDEENEKKKYKCSISLSELHAPPYVHTIWKYRINTVCLFLCAVLILCRSVRVVLISSVLTFSMLAAAAAAVAICFQYLRWTVWVLCHILRNRANGNSASVTSQLYEQYGLQAVLSLNTETTTQQFALFSLFAILNFIWPQNVTQRK